MATLLLNRDHAGVCAVPAAEEITLAAWRDGVRPKAGRFALVIPNTEEIPPLAAAIAAFDVIILEFPDFRDGRAFSQARVLREQLGYGGAIWARGALLPDQALFLARAGFTDVEIADADPAPFAAALSAYSVVYQAAADDAHPVHALRARHRDAA